MLGRLRLLRHLWLDASDAQRRVGEAALANLERRVRESEARHTGEICLCVEASLPVSYLWRHVRFGESLEEVVRERALALFGKLRVWDTELNNGVLIYLLLAEHRIEIVADRGLARAVAPDAWERLLAAMRDDFRTGHYEEGLARAIDAVGAALEAHFPAAPGEAAERDNLIPDRPVIR